MNCCRGITARSGTRLLLWTVVLAWSAAVAPSHAGDAASLSAPRFEVVPVNNARVGEGAFCLNDTLNRPSLHGRDRFQAGQRRTECAVKFCLKRCWYWALSIVHAMARQLTAAFTPAA